MRVLSVCFELVLWGGNKISKVGEGRKKERRREIKIGWLRKWGRDGSALRAVCERALVSGNEHGLDGYGGSLLERAKA